MEIYRNKRALFQRDQRNLKQKILAMENIRTLHVRSDYQNLVYMKKDKKCVPIELDIGGMMAVLNILEIGLGLAPNKQYYEG